MSPHGVIVPTAAAAVMFNVWNANTIRAINPINQPQNPTVCLNELSSLDIRLFDNTAAPRVMATGVCCAICDVFWRGAGVCEMLLLVRLGRGAVRAA